MELYSESIVNEMSKNPTIDITGDDGNIEFHLHDNQERKDRTTRRINTLQH